MKISFGRKAQCLFSGIFEQILSYLNSLFVKDKNSGPATQWEREWKKAKADDFQVIFWFSLSCTLRYIYQKSEDIYAKNSWCISSHISFLIKSVLSNLTLLLVLRWVEFREDWTGHPLVRERKKYERKKKNQIRNKSSCQVETALYERPLLFSNLNTHSNKTVGQTLHFLAIEDRWDE